jgi:hypothetical protein
VSIPPFDPETGVLPPGEHAASWDDVLDRFGWNVTRRRQLDGLVERSPSWPKQAAGGCG